jgi:hypothetical protein
MFISETIFSDSYAILNTASSQDEALHKFHTMYEQPIFNSLRSRYLHKLKDWWNKYELPLVSNTDRCIVIYETRCHANLEFIIYNLTYFAKDWGLIIYCSKANYDYINNILQHNRFRAILQIIRDDEGGKSVRDEYNEFVKLPIFWNSLPCKYVLMCEMDAYLRRHITDDITNFDYVCCKWPWCPNVPGGGGISFRRVSSMKRICDEYPSLAKNIFAQDSWAAEGSIRLNLSFNNTYLVESTHHITNPIGFHNWWTFIKPFEMHNFFSIYDKYLTLEI